MEDRKKKTLPRRRRIGRELHLCRACGTILAVGEEASCGYCTTCQDAPTEIEVTQAAKQLLELTLIVRRLRKQLAGKRKGVRR